MTFPTVPAAGRAPFVRVALSLVVAAVIGVVISAAMRPAELAIDGIAVVSGTVHAEGVVLNAGTSPVTLSDASGHRPLAPGQRTAYRVTAKERSLEIVHADYRSVRRTLYEGTGAAPRPASATVPAARPDAGVSITTRSVMLGPGTIVDGVAAYSGVGSGPAFRVPAGSELAFSVRNDTKAEQRTEIVGLPGRAAVVITSAPNGRSVERVALADDGRARMLRYGSPDPAERATGVYGVVLVEPRGLAPVDREIVLTQFAQGRADLREIAAFNGVAYGFTDHPIEARRGERIRIWLLDAGAYRHPRFTDTHERRPTVRFEGLSLTAHAPEDAQAVQSDQSGTSVRTTPERGIVLETTLPAAPGRYHFYAAGAYEGAGAVGIIVVR